MTQKQVDAINAACRNGFSFDRYDFAVLGEKRLSKIITLVKDRKEVKLSLSWRDEVVKVENEHGCMVPTYTGNVVPQLHCSIWDKAPGESCWHSYGLGKYHVFTDKTSPKRLMNRLCEITELVTDNLVCEMLPDKECAEFRQKAERKVNEVNGVVISRVLLDEYGYDGNMPTDEQMQMIADELLEYWGVSGCFKDALDSTMSNIFGVEAEE